ncbi:ABC transporter substrate-binding protein [Inquilinus limosus]|uniref:ABC transporter substrate-binding protein n=1 Tax=Inquilinus limosus MP06 TaxID=1398085 RepID=A0A0A0DA80_9PROT|nr:ABC transporter substrate-binding protein [Inquilinus limosus]KGM35641.1 ABC transporter substrate-binding protein [Inquilinus limosus MP06]
MGLRTAFGMGVALALALAGPARAEDPIRIADVIELSGAGATVGTNWKNAIEMAVEEINQKGGILGRTLEVSHYDTQTNPGVSRAQVQKALDEEPYVIFGPIFSGSVKVNMMLAQQAEVPQFTGAEATELTQAGNPYIFRTSISQAAAMPKLANYLADDLKAKKVAVVWVNNDFGKGGHDAILEQMKAHGIEVVADLSTESGQADFAADVVKLKSSGADAAIVYTNEEESARFLREARKQAIAIPLIGETTLLNQKVIDLAGDAANGVRGHVGLSADAPFDTIRAFRDRFQARYGYLPDHNAIKAYLAVYAVRYATQKIGKVDSVALAETLHGLTITTQDEPGILIDTTWDANGDVDRVSFLAEVENGRQVIVKTLPKLGH